MSWAGSAYAVAALVFQTLLLAYFVARTWWPEATTRFGWIVYALALPAAALGAASLIAGAPWAFGVAGLIYLAWGVFGFIVDVAPGVTWRAPVRWAVFIPYSALYLGTAMFYWWPVALVVRPLWYVAGAIFVIAAALNVISHVRAIRGTVTPPPGSPPRVPSAS